MIRKRGTPRRALAVVALWRAAGFDRWFEKSEVFDALIRTRLGALREAAEAGLLVGWEETPPGALALVILLDQVPRNMFRGSPSAFATDPDAVVVAASAIARGFDARIPRDMRSFLYLPFEHAEDPALQRECVRLFEALGDPVGLDYAKTHAEIIARFGRFPHRNETLGRRSSCEEIAFLDGGGFAG